MNRMYSVRLTNKQQWHCISKFRVGLTQVAQCLKQQEFNRKQIDCNFKHLKSAVAISAGVSLALFTCSCANAAASSNWITAEGGILHYLLSFVLHLDKHLGDLVGACSNNQWRIYGVIFGIVFAETGLVVTPFLPGDSLLFAAGALAGIQVLNLQYLLLGIFFAAVVGDAVNYAVGAWMGEKAMSSKLVNAKHVDAANQYFKRFGGKTIILARFIPIVRTFAPFVAGVGSMSYSRFAWFNILGAAIWTACFVCAGFWFGNFPVVKKNFGVIVIAIVSISVLPIVIEMIQNRRDTPKLKPSA